MRVIHNNARAGHIAYFYNVKFGSKQAQFICIIQQVNLILEPDQIGQHMGHRYPMKTGLYGRLQCVNVHSEDVAGNSFHTHLFGHLSYSSGRPQATSQHQKYATLNGALFLEIFSKYTMALNGTYHLSCRRQRNH